MLIDLNTVFWLFALSIALCLIGSIMLPTHLEFFSGIDDSPLFLWLNNAGNLANTWWVYALIGSIALLALSTIACTIEALIKPSTRGMVFKLSPQVMHIGVLFVMLGHLLTAAYGIRTDVLIQQGSTEMISKELSVKVNNVHAEINKAGTSTRWKAELELAAKGKPLIFKTLAPVHPVYINGYGLFFSTFNEPGSGELPSAVIRVTRDPGAVWALMGGVLVTLGGLGFLISRKPVKI